MHTPSTRQIKAAAAPQQPLGATATLPKRGYGLVPGMFSLVGRSFLALPFDNLRFQYANAVRSGLSPRSLIASGRGERAVDALEKMVLGPLARQR